MNDILLKIAEQYYFEGSLDGTWEDNKHVLEPAKEDIKKFMLNLLAQSRQKTAPLTWLESEINKL